MVATRAAKDKRKSRCASERRISSRIKDNAIKHESDAVFAALVLQQQQQQQQQQHANGHCAATAANEPQVVLTDAEIEATLRHCDLLEVEVKAALVTLRRQTLQPELLQARPFELPFTADEIKSIGHRKIARHPPPFGRINRSIYLIPKNKTKSHSKQPGADLPVHKCNCYEEIKSSGSTTRPGKSNEDTAAAPAFPKKRAAKSSVASAPPAPQDLEPVVLYCGERCHNRMLLISCSDDTCAAPEHLCTNRAIQRRENKPVRVEYVEGCGFGLFAEQTIEPGEFVIEYVGEVIDDLECERRLIKYRDQGEAHFYMLEIEKDVVVDARYRSNDARFINHSCDSNCMTQKWNVDGQRRIGIFARRRVLAGEEITIDYNFSHFGDPMDCKCGSVSCTGKLGLKRSEMQIKQSLQKISASSSSSSRKNLELMEAPPPEIKKPVLLTSLALLKSAKLDVQWLNLYGFNKRRLFVGSKKRGSHGPATATTTDMVTGLLTVENTGLLESTSTSTSTSITSSPLSSEWSSTTDEELLSSHKPPQQQKSCWYESFQRGDHLREMRALQSYACGGKHDWSDDLLDFDPKRPHRFPPPRSGTKQRVSKRVSLLDARARCFADLIAFANGASKWNARVPSSSRIDPDRIYRFIDNMKNGKQFLNHNNQNDLNEDTCHRCSLAGELICCDGCPAAFHLNCTNLAFVPPDNVPWFCDECMRRERQRTQIDCGTPASASGATDCTAVASEGRHLRAKHHNSAAPVVPSLKRIFHNAPSTKDAAAQKKRPRKKLKTADKSYRLLEQMPLPMWEEGDDE